MYTRENQCLTNLVVWLARLVRIGRVIYFASNRTGAALIGSYRLRVRMGSAAFDDCGADVLSANRTEDEQALDIASASYE
jgi:hypothetical protein